MHSSTTPPLTTTSIINKYNCCLSDSVNKNCKLHKSRIHGRAAVLDHIRVYRCVSLFISAGLFKSLFLPVLILSILQTIYFITTVHLPSTVFHWYFILLCYNLFSIYIIVPYLNFCTIFYLIFYVLFLLAWFFLHIVWTLLKWAWELRPRLPGEKWMRKKCETEWSHWVWMMTGWGSGHW